MVGDAGFEDDVLAQSPDIFASLYCHYRAEVRGGMCERADIVEGSFMQPLRMRGRVQHSFTFWIF